MRVITKYLAKDGVEFDTKSACMKHENILKKINNIMRVFIKQTGLYVQQDKDIIPETRIRLLKLMQKHIDHTWIQETMDNTDIDSSYVSRLLEGSNDVFNNAWFRFSCMDKEGREWEQPYYAKHPEEGLAKGARIAG